MLFEKILKNNSDEYISIFLDEKNQKTNCIGVNKQVSNVDNRVYETNRKKIAKHYICNNYIVIHKLNFIIYIYIKFETYLMNFWYKQP